MFEILDESVSYDTQEKYKFKNRLFRAKFTLFKKTCNYPITQHNQLHPQAPQNKRKLQSLEI